MTLHETAFEYLTPTDAQKDDMQVLRQASATYASAIEAMLPEGPDKTFILRNVRTIAMWCNVAITRDADGSPRQ